MLIVCPDPSVSVCLGLPLTEASEDELAHPHRRCKRIHHFSSLCAAGYEGLLLPVGTSKKNQIKPEDRVFSGSSVSGRARLRSQ